MVGAWLQLDLRPKAAIWHYLDPSGRRAPIWLSGLSGRPRGWPIWLSGPIWAYLDFRLVPYLAIWNPLCLGLSGQHVSSYLGYLGYLGYLDGLCL